MDLILWSSGGISTQGRYYILTCHCEMVIIGVLIKDFMVNRAEAGFIWLSVDAENLLIGPLRIYSAAIPKAYLEFWTDAERSNLENASPETSDEGSLPVRRIDKLGKRSRLMVTGHTFGGEEHTITTLLMGMESTSEDPEIWREFCKPFYLRPTTAPGLDALNQARKPFVGTATPLAITVRSYEGMMPAFEMHHLRVAADFFAKYPQSLSKPEWLDGDDHLR